MKSAPLGSAETSNSEQSKQPGIIRKLRSIPWRLEAALRKDYYRFQDWSGLYSYQDWCRKFEQRKMKYADSPDICISIIIKVTASSLKMLKDTCSSLIQQSYPNWKAYLILDINDTTVDLPVGFQEDPRIKWAEDSSTPLWKAGINAVNGDWVVFMNSGDTLSADALSIAAHAIMENPSAIMVYPDTDQLSEDGLIRHSPRFWPDWSPDLLLSVNYITAAFIRKSELIEPAQKTDDLEAALLLIIEKTGKIIHLPYVLYHQHDNQTKPWLGATFQKDNLVAHLERVGLKNVSAHISSNRPMQFIWEFGSPFISIIMLSRDRVKLLKQCLDSISNNTSYQNFEVILVENNSRQAETFAYYESLETNPRVMLLERNLPFNYSAFNNWGAQRSNGELLLFLNNDIQCFEPGWLEELARWAIRAEIGVVGAKLLYPEGAIQHAGLIIGLEGHANHIFAKKEQGYQGIFGTDEWYRDYSAVTGACMMVRREVFDQVGGFDEQYSLAFNDIEFCLRVTNAGYRIAFTPFARLIHHEGATRAKQKPANDIQLAWQHLRPLIKQGDPYYNLNLSLSLRIPTLRRSNEIAAVERLEQILEYEG